MLPYADRIKLLRDFLSERMLMSLEEVAEVYPDKRSVLLDIRSLDTFNCELTDYLYQYPDSFFKTISGLLPEMDLLLDESQGDIERLNFRPINVTPIKKVRDLMSADIHKLVSVAGIVQSVSEKSPRYDEITWECGRCGHEWSIDYDEASFFKPTECPNDECGRDGPFRISNDGTHLLDSQQIELRDIPESLQSHERPGVTRVIIEDDLVDSVLPGDRIVVTGDYKVMRKPIKEGVRPVLTTYVYARSIEMRQAEFSTIEITDEDIKQIVAISESKDLETRLFDSVAPDIYGLTDIKKAILLSLFSSPDFITASKTWIRGAIHVLIVGDPGIAKSKLLEWVENTAPKSVSVSGKTTTTAGLTAAIVQDSLGKKSLEAGALVLAHNGVLCLDEINQLSDTEKSSLHESMERGKIHFSKAGLSTVLLANTSIIAVGNPQSGRFAPYKTISEQLGFEGQAPLLSRFDWIGIARDIPNEIEDAHLVKHMLATRKGSNAKPGTLTTELLRKYIGYARKMCSPVLGDEAELIISKYYLDIRVQSTKNGHDAITITPRAFMSIERLCKAAARMRLSDVVEARDATLAVSIYNASLIQTGVDPETGNLDADMIAIGNPKSQRKRVDFVERMIRELKEDGTNEVDYAELLEVCESSNITKFQLDPILERLRTECVIYYKTGNLSKFTVA